MVSILSSSNNFLINNNNETLNLIKHDVYLFNFHLNTIFKNYNFSTEYIINCFQKLEKSLFLSKEDISAIKENVYKNIQVLQIIKKYIRLKYEKKYFSYPIEQDLSLNELNTYHNKDIIHIKDHNNKTFWSFYYKDLIQIIQKQLLYQEQAFPMPNKPKNPYTNQCFTKDNLYKIFSKINNYQLPLELRIFYESDFDLKKMLSGHYYYFCKKTCKDYIKNLDKHELYKEIQYSILTYIGEGREINWVKICSDQNLREKFEKVLFDIFDVSSTITDKEIEKNLHSILVDNKYYKLIRGLRSINSVETEIINPYNNNINENENTQNTNIYINSDINSINLDNINIGSFHIGSVNNRRNHRRRIS